MAVSNIIGSMDNEIGKVVDVATETDVEITEMLTKLSKGKNEVYVTMIASYVGLKISPSKEVSAHLGLSEEFGVETLIEDIKKEAPNCKTLYLLVNSPGGLVQSSYKIALALRQNFEKIIIFVPHVAASGGTLIALTGNEIVMGLMSQLTPLDPNDGEGTSALSIVRGYEQVVDWFRKTSIEDSPYPHKVLADKYDAIMLDEAISVMNLMENYIKEILHLSGYPPESLDRIAEKLVKEPLTHGDVINYDKAKEFGLNVVKQIKYEGLWDLFRLWLGKYVLQSTDKHIIRYYIPQSKKEVK